MSTADEGAAARESGSSGARRSETHAIPDSCEQFSAARDEAVAWMNQGCALMVRGNAAALEEAIVCYAHAAKLLRALPREGKPSWANSLGAAWMNHGQLLHRAYGLDRADEALRSFAEAIAVLTEIAPGTMPWSQRNLAGTYINRANLWLDRAEQETQMSPVPGAQALQSARADAEAALRLMQPTERDHPIDADLALKARRVLCDTLGQILGRTHDSLAQDALASSAADVVDDALELVRAWQTRSETAFDDLAVRFFRFGAELYRHHQPYFLVEFLEENLAVASARTQELRTMAREVLTAALRDGARVQLHSLDDPGSQRALRAREEIAAALARFET